MPNIGIAGALRGTATSVLEVSFGRSAPIITVPSRDEATTATVRTPATSTGTGRYSSVKTCFRSSIFGRSLMAM